jgi:hypothetical protein
MKMVLLRTILLLSILCLGRVHAGWFGPDHYYLITSTEGDEYTSKGEPWEKGDFTVFTQWPEQREFKIKTALVASIKDTGSLSPEEVVKKEEEKKSREIVVKLLTLFAISPKTHQPHFVPETLAKARQLGATTDQIYTALNKELRSLKESNIPCVLANSYNPKGNTLDEFAEMFLENEKKCEAMAHVDPN